MDMREKKLQNTLKDIKLVNHACFSFYFDGKGCLVDPWFGGSIFNSSWKLASEGGEAPDNLKYIFITHEHPDHLHWPTLSRLASPDITVVLCERNNDNVESNLKKLGYTVLSIPDKVKHDLGGLSFEFFRSGHDHTLVFEKDNFVMVNQNDCQLGHIQATELKVKYPNIDIWWMQFSLAGYYGNPDNEDALISAQAKHKNMFSSYKNILNPKVSIPFASFINFCRKENLELNNYRVKLQDILDENTQVQILYKDDIFLEENYEDRNLQNIVNWENAFNTSVDIETPTTTRLDFEKVFQDFCLKYSPQGQLQFELFDDVGCVLNFTDKTVKFQTPTTPIAKVCLFDLQELFKNLWGADTMNITSCFHVYMEEAWRGILLSIDGLYAR